VRTRTRAQMSELGFVGFKGLGGTGSWGHEPGRSNINKNGDRLCGRGP
jgi:hypothetical protein